MDKKKAAIHLLGDLESAQTLCGLGWKKSLGKGDSMTLEVNQLLAGRWYTRPRVPCPECISALEKKLETYHTHHNHLEQP